MAQDYAKKGRGGAKRHAPEPRIPAWVWLFTGAVLGAFVMFLMRLSEVSPGQASPPEPEVAGERSGKQDGGNEKDEKQTPRFDFYDLLKETKVEVPEFSRDQKKQAATTEEPLEFILQVASFKSDNDAEQLRAELILLNLEARTERAKIRNGETWHRVLVGPFTSRSKLAKARSTLISNRHEALVLKRKPQQ